VASIISVEEETKQETSLKQATSRPNCFLLVALMFDSKDGGSTLLRNVGKLLLDYTASDPTREFSS
jgi:hypothetical protein